MDRILRIKIRENPANRVDGMTGIFDRSTGVVVLSTGVVVFVTKTRARGIFEGAFLLLEEHRRVITTAGASSMSTADIIENH